MATFDPKQFIENPDATEFKSLNKDKLFALAEHLELSDVKKSMKNDLNIIKKVYKLFPIKITYKRGLCTNKSK